MNERNSVSNRSVLAGVGGVLLLLGLAIAPLVACGKSEPAPEAEGGLALKDPEPAALEASAEAAAEVAADTAAEAEVVAHDAAAIPGGPPPLPKKPGLRHDPTLRRPNGNAPVKPVIQTSTGTEPPPASAAQPVAPVAANPTPEEATADAVRPTPPTISSARPAVGAVVPPAPAGGEEPAAEAAGETPGAAVPAHPPRKSAPPELAPTGEESPPTFAGTAPPAGDARAPVKVGAPSVPPLDVERYLPLEVVREIVGEPRIMPTGPLAGIPATPSYNSAHFAPPGSKRFGASLQVWQDASRLAVNERFRRAKRQYPHAQETRALDPAKAFFSYFGKLQTLTFMDSDKQLVVSVTCAEDVCTQEKLLMLAKHARQAL